jgi:hypothetical protein
MFSDSLAVCGVSRLLVISFLTIIFSAKMCVDVRSKQFNFFVLMQIAAKINPTGTSESVGQKRPLEDGSGMDWTGKLIHRPSLQSGGIVFL